MAAFGTTRNKWADIPPYRETTPSSFITSFNVCNKPVYLGIPFFGIGSLNRVLITSCGYAIHAAINFATAAAPKLPTQAKIKCWFQFICWIFFARESLTFCTFTANCCFILHLSRGMGPAFLKVFINDPLDWSFNNTEIGSAHAFVEPFDAFFFQNLQTTIETAIINSSMSL